MIYLASKSPRRKSIFELLGCQFEITKPNGVKEDKFTQKPLEETVISNASKKALSCAEAVSEGIIIGADTEVFLEGRIFGKPDDEEEAFEMLSLLKGKTHTVMTGVAVIDKGYTDETLLFYDVSNVTFHPFKDKEILAYIQNNNCLDKAGAYAVQNAGSTIISDISGSIWNVIGFPLEKFKENIKEKRYSDLFSFPEKFKEKEFCLNYLTT